MPLRNTSDTYGSVTKSFHWAIFLLVGGMLAAGFVMTGMENGPDKFRLYGLHKATGVTVLLLALLRLGWKLANVRPLLPASMHPLEKFAARAGHAALYVLIIAMPLSGWLMSSAAGFSVSVYGWFTLPDLIAPDRKLAEDLRDLHEWLAWAIIVMVSLHALAALLHHFYHKDNVLRRMLPFAGVLALAVAVPAYADVPAWNVIKDKSFLKFYAIQNSAPVVGKFEDFTADIRFDPAQPDKSSIVVEVATGSVATAHEEVGKNLRLPEWLAVEAFPVAVFRSKTLTRMPRSDNYYAEGELTLRDRTMPVTLNFSLRQAGDKRTIATGFVTLRRSDFHVGQGEWSRDDVIKNEVRVEFRIVADKK